MPLVVLCLCVLIIEMINKTVTFLSVFSLRVWSHGSLWCRSIG